MKTFPLPGNGFTHDVNVDSHGITWVTGEDGTFGFDTTDPLNPQLLLRSDESVTNTGGGLPGDDGSGPLDFLHHNSLRITGRTRSRSRRRTTASPAATARARCRRGRSPTSATRTARRS